MSIALSGTVTISAGGKVLTFIDETTGIVGFVSRTLVINDPNGVPIASFDMGTNTSQAYTISADGYFEFVETIVDVSGSHVLTINKVADGIYKATYLNIIKLVGCSCNCSNETFTSLFVGQLFDSAANWFGLFGQGVQAQNNVQAANTYINA